MGAGQFRLREFIVRQEKCAMKVGTDGILLGAWAPLTTGDILDIGTGTGLLALMAAQRNPESRITAIEIEPQAAAQAQDNFAASPWGTRLQTVQTAIQNYQPASHFDLLLCNPPYFKAGLLPPEKSRARARHDEGLSFAALAAHSSRLVGPSGRLAVIIPFDRLGDMRESLQAHGWFLWRQTRVRPVVHKDYHRVLLLAGRSQGVLQSDELSITNASGTYTRQFMALTGAFYL